MADGVDTAYSFPLLNTKSIVSYLKGLQIHVVEEVVMNPKQNATQVTVVLEKLVEKTLGATKEQMSQPAFAGLGHLSNPELHDDQITFMALFRNICKMMKISRIDDFSLKDMSEPTRPRLRRQLSAVLNFARFREGKEGIYQDMLARKKTIRETARTEQIRNNDLVDKLEDLKDRMAEKKQEIDEVEAKAKAAKKDTADLGRTASTIRDESAQLKKASFVAKDKVASAHTKLKQTEIEKERLQGQVVTSPQRILREGADQKQALEQELADVEAEVNNTQKLQQSTVVLGRAKRELVKAAAAMDEVGTEVSRQEQAFREVKGTQRKITGKKGELLTRSSDITEGKRRLTRFEEKLSHLRKQATFKTEATAEELQAVREAIEETEKQWTEASARLEESKAIMEQRKKEKENVETQIANQVEETEQLMQQVIVICRNHGHRLQAAMKEGSAPSSMVLT